MPFASQTSPAQVTVSSGIMKRVFQQPARPPPGPAPSSAKRTRMSCPARVTVGGCWYTQTLLRSCVSQAYSRQAPLIAAQDVFM